MIVQNFGIGPREVVGNLEGCDSNFPRHTTTPPLNKKDKKGL